MYTKGPLEIVNETRVGGRFVVKSERGNVVAMGMTQDDATLFAAAPDLVEAHGDNEKTISKVMAMVRGFNHLDDPNLIMRKIGESLAIMDNRSRAALRKAGVKE